MSELKSGGSEGLPVPAPLVTSVVLLLNENNIKFKIRVPPLSTVVRKNDAFDWSYMHPVDCVKPVL
jgi:hypothetical protein